MILKIASELQTCWYPGVNEIEQLYCFDMTPGEDPYACAEKAPAGASSDHVRPKIEANYVHVLKFGESEKYGLVLQGKRSCSPIHEAWIVPASSAFLLSEESGKTVDRI